MKIAVLDSVVIALEGTAGAIKDFVAQEYAAFLQPSPAAGQSDIAADITIEVCDDQVDPRLSRYLARHLARDQHGLFWQDAHNRTLRLDFDSLNSGTWQLRCDPDFDPQLFDRLLLQLLQLRLLVGKTVLCPAAAFSLDGRNVLCPSAPGNGRTSLVMQMLRRGATFLTHDWVALRSTRQLRSLNKPLRLHWRNFELCPELIEHLPAPAAALAAFLGHVGAGDYDLPRPLVQALQDRLPLEVAPAALFETAPPSAEVTIDALFMPVIKPQAREEIAIESLSARQMVTTLSAIIELAMGDLLDAYSAFRMESGQRIDLLDHWRDTCEEILLESLATIPQAYRVLLPAERATAELGSIIESTLDGSHEDGPVTDGLAVQSPAA